jgi:taurine transport system permease protein
LQSWAGGLEMNNAIRRLVPVATLVLMALLWGYLTSGQSSGSVLNFPSPGSVWTTVVEHWNMLLQAAMLTTYRVGVGILIGGTIGVLLGVVACRFSLLFDAINPLVELLRPVPPIALTPFFIIWLGIGNFSQISLIALGSFMILFVSTTGAIGNLDALHERAFLSLGGDRNGLVRAVWIPGILPDLLVALRVTLATAFALTVAAEYLGAQGGLGYVIRNARVLLDMTAILVAAALLGLCSYVSDFLLRWFMLRLTDWVPRAQHR